MQWEVADDHRIAGGAAQLTSQAVVVEPQLWVCFPCVLGDGGRLAEALGDVRRADLLAEHAGSRGFRRR
jgi:hypothetical protein